MRKLPITVCPLVLDVLGTRHPFKKMSMNNFMNHHSKKPNPILSTLRKKWITLSGFFLLLWGMGNAIHCSKDIPSQLSWNIPISEECPFFPKEIQPQDCQSAESCREKAWQSLQRFSYPDYVQSIGYAIAGLSDNNPEREF